MNKETKSPNREASYPYEPPKALRHSQDQGHPLSKEKKQGVEESHKGTDQYSDEG
jgi:hypothetical protein